MGRRPHLLFLGRGGEVVRYQGVMKQKSPDFLSPTVGISGFLRIIIGFAPEAIINSNVNDKQIFLVI